MTGNGRASRHRDPLKPTYGSGCCVQAVGAAGAATCGSFARPPSRRGPSGSLRATLDGALRRFRQRWGSRPRIRYDAAEVDLALRWLAGTRTFVQLRRELAADEDDEHRVIHPGQQDDHATDGAVRLVVRPEVLN